MKSYISLCSVILVSSTAFSQRPNLVPNPGFENLRIIPTEPMTGEMSQYISGWQQGSQGSADILTQQAPLTAYANPNSTCKASIGHEDPHGGNNMGMIMTSAHDDYREYLGCNLAQPLVVGRSYHVEAYVSLADYSGFATNNIGFFFQTGVYRIAPGYKIFGTPQVNCTEVISTTNGWVKVGGDFKADQPYTYFMIGNFLPEQIISKQKNMCDISHQQYADHSAYYIDDVSVFRNTDLEATGDSVVVTGTMATLNATGGNAVYTWADSNNPGIVLGTGATLQIKVQKKTTFRVSCGNEFADVTVNVKKRVLQYIAELQGRQVLKGRTIIVHSDQIVISVYDKYSVDGDSVSLYYGDSLIVEHLELTHEHQTFTLKIDKQNPRQIILFAENLGTSPPNTAALIIKDGKESADLLLESDLLTCDSFMLVYKEDD